MKNAFIFIVALLVIFVLCGCACQHDWIEANCDMPKTCSICEAVEGEPLTHAWIEATCNEAKTCSLCKTADGKPIGHKPGDWVPEKTDYVTATESFIKSCTVCGNSIDSMEQPISLIQNDKFLINTDEFVERLNLIYDQADRSDLKAEYFENEYNELMISILRDDTVILLIYITGTEMDPASVALSDLLPLTYEHTDKRMICYFFAFIPYTSLNNGGSTENLLNLFNDYTLYEDALFGPMMACDPALSFDDASATINNAWTETHNFLVFSGEDLIHNTPCGELYIKFINTFLTNGMVQTIIFPSELYWTKSAN